MTINDLVGPEFEIIVAQISKYKEGGGLGISLEGTVEKVDGAEQNPHHYIRYLLGMEVFLWSSFYKLLIEIFSSLTFIVMISDRSFKEGHVRLTTVPFKP